ncbi:uncharacterized protein GGS25DRAFT_522957 [Hypoxylon fragiforme]|uniref:uncharacterized protein n=1 Tax=Hypoxylon fragiforme TaxID=63214 RepID=UPI0020C65C89|nr:uncharacterized protein GGS25DRAFT_522957 [Hypoxylon fragiforme]KAI2607437.1 hypothetical protein GGS25DRAFT_522957 [Hypoxylon fragiforme]
MSVSIATEKAVGPKIVDKSRSSQAESETDDRPDGPRMERLTTPQQRPSFAEILSYSRLDMNTLLQQFTVDGTDIKINCMQELIKWAPYVFGFDLPRAPHGYEFTPDIAVVIEEFRLLHSFPPGGATLHMSKYSSVLFTAASIIPRPIVLPASLIVPLTFKSLRLMYHNILISADGTHSSVRTCRDTSSRQTEPETLPAA